MRIDRRALSRELARYLEWLLGIGGLLLIAFIAIGALSHVDAAMPIDFGAPY